MIASLPAYLFAALLIAAAAGDALYFRIPNQLVLLIAGLFLPVALVAGLGLPAIGTHLAISGAVLLGGFLLFALGLFGGGDAKLLAAAALWLGWPALLPFLVWTALAGGLLGMLIGLRVLFDRFVRKVPVNRDVPYGIALASGAIIALPQCAWMWGS
jgi:prepilin peptidase CpaA